MKEFGKKLWGLIWNKTALAYLLGGISGILGFGLSDETINSLVCLLNVAGCN